MGVGPKSQDFGLEQCSVETALLDGTCLTGIVEASLAHRQDSPRLSLALVPGAGAALRVQSSAAEPRIGMASPAMVPGITK